MEVNNVVNSYAAPQPVETVQTQNHSNRQENVAVEPAKNAAPSVENQTTGKGTVIDKAV